MDRLPTVRIGLRTGEVETIAGKAGGLAVVIGARIAASAGPSEILVSQTVRDLTAGSDLESAKVRRPSYDANVTEPPGG